MHPHLSQALVDSNRQELMRHAQAARLATECRARRSRMSRLHRLLTVMPQGGGAGADRPVAAPHGAVIAR